MTTTKKINNILRHIKGVQENCQILGMKLIENGQEDLGRKLIANSFLHDNSKFYGIEWYHLGNTSSHYHKEAIRHHDETNPHHPEYWGGIRNMPEEYLLEMLCDWKQRSSEFGTDLKEWIKEKATEKYNFSMKDKIGQKIKKYLNLLLDKPFS